jgi:adenylylsulfate kinase
MQDCLGELHPICVWLTDIPCAGKSTISRALSAQLSARVVSNTVLDADDIRRTLNADPGFSRTDRRENVRRISEVAKMFLTSDIVPIVAAIVPYRDDRIFATSMAVVDRLLHHATIFDMNVDGFLCRQSESNNLKPMPRFNCPG